MAQQATRDPRYTEIESHRPYLVRYALAQLRDAQLAEEAVQEALLAALEGLSGFNGQSSLRTWLTSILRFKVIDLQRRAATDRQREAHTDYAEDAEAGDETWLDDLFDETGHWREAPQTWSNPESALEQRRFWEVMEKCLDRLPAAGGRVFFKREVLGEDTPAICQSEGITESNCWVILHRARIALRGCLEANWFGQETARGR
ncbi:MAG TPA: sigma-70 family RNA polymerase sigma factor [Usitatibacteraceae bacterium]|nr:sigma-70 family RNA polymerase sigma factor [Usitatibacteraceae bacterium]